MDNDMKQKIQTEIYNALASAANKKLSFLGEIQPTTSVLEAAAQAAAQVIAAFEIGYQMGE